MPRLNGVAAAVYSNLTDYELSMKNVIPMLAAVPLATGARKRGARHWAPHVALGAFELGMALLTKQEAPRSRTRSVARVLKLAR